MSTNMLSPTVQHMCTTYMYNICVHCTHVFYTVHKLRTIPGWTATEHPRPSDLNISKTIGRILTKPIYLIVDKCIRHLTKFRNFRASPSYLNPVSNLRCQPELNSDMGRVPTKTWIHGSTDSWICGLLNLDSWIHGFLDSQILGFKNS